MAKKAFNGNVPVSIKELYGNLTNQYGYKKPELEFRINIEENFIKPNSYEHIYNPDTKRSYADMYGVNAAKQLAQDLREIEYNSLQTAVDDKILIDEELIESFAGEEQLKAISTRQNSTSNSQSDIKRFIATIGSLFSDIQQSISEVARNNMNKSDSGFDLEKSRNEIEKEREHEEYSQQQQRTEEKYHAQTASETIRHEEEVRQLEQKYNEENKRREELYEQEVKNYQSQIEEELKRQETLKYNEENIQNELKSLQAKKQEELSFEELKKQEELKLNSTKYEEEIKLSQTKVSEYENLKESSKTSYEREQERNKLEYEKRIESEKNTYTINTSKIDSEYRNTYESNKQIYENRINKIEPIKEHTDEYSSKISSYESEKASSIISGDSVSFNDEQSKILDTSSVVYTNDSFAHPVSSGYNIPENDYDSKIHSNQESRSQYSSSSPVSFTSNTYEKQSEDLSRVFDSSEHAGETINSQKYDEAEKISEAQRNASKEAIDQTIRSSENIGKTKFWDTYKKSMPEFSDNSNNNEYTKTSDFNTTEQNKSYENNSTSTGDKTNSTEKSYEEKHKFEVPKSNEAESDHLIRRTAKSTVGFFSSEAEGFVELIGTVAHVYNNFSNNFAETHGKQIEPASQIDLINTLDRMAEKALNTPQSENSFGNNINDLTKESIKNMESMNDASGFKIKSEFTRFKEQNTTEVEKNSFVEQSKNVNEMVKEAVKNSESLDFTHKKQESTFIPFDRAANERSKTDKAFNEEFSTVQNKSNNGNVNEMVKNSQQNLEAQISRRTKEVMFGNGEFVSAKGEKYKSEKNAFDKSAAQTNIFEKIINGKTIQTVYSGLKVDQDTIGQQKMSAATGMTNDTLNKIKTSQQAIAQEMQAMAKAKNLASQSVNAFNRTNQLASKMTRLNQDESYAGYAQYTYYVAPIIKVGSTAAKLIAMQKQAQDILNNMDFEKVGKLLRTSTDRNAMNVLSEKEAASFGIKTFKGDAGVEFTANLRKQMGARYGGIYTKENLGIKELRANIKSLQKQMQGLTGESLKRVQEEYEMARTLLGGLATGAQKDLKEMLKGGLRNVGRVGLMFTQSLTDNSAATDMLKFANRTGRVIRFIRRRIMTHDTLYTKALKTAQKLANWGVSPSAPWQVVKRPAKAVVRGTTKITRKAGQKVAKKIQNKAVRRAAGRLHRTLQRGVIRTVGNKIGAKFLATKVGAALAKVATDVAAKTGLSAFIGASGAATGGIAWVIYIIIAIIVCCICCCCSMGTGYSVYENVDAFGINATGDTVKAEESIAMRTIAFMNTYFDGNYDEFIFNGVEKYLTEDVTEVVWEEPFNGIEYEDGKVSVIDPRKELPEKFEKYIFLKDVSGIAYSDYDHTVQDILGGVDFQLNDAGGVTARVINAIEKDDVNAFKNPVRNTKEIISMSATAMANDLALNNGGDVSVKTLANFENYSATLWLASHYCVMQTEAEHWWEALGNWFASLFDNFWKKDKMNDVEEEYKKYITEKVYLTSLYCVWDKESEGVNIIAPLSQNIFHPTNYHYINVPLEVKDATIRTQITNAIAELPVNKNEGSYVDVIGIWKQSDDKYYPTPDQETGEGLAEGTAANIANSTLKFNINIRYEYIKKELNDNWTKLSNPSYPSPPSEGYFSSGSTPSGILSSYNAAYNEAKSALSNSTPYYNSTRYEGERYETKESAKNRTISVVNEIFDLVDKYYGDVTETNRGKLLEELSPSNNALLDATTCGAATIPYGDKFISREDALKMVEMAYTGYVSQIKLEDSLTFPSFNVNEYKFDSSKTKKIGTGEYTDDIKDPITGAILVPGKEKTETVYTSSAVQLKQTHTIKIPTVPAVYGYPLVFESGSEVRSIESGQTVSKFKEIYGQALVCGGHTQLVIQPVTLTFVGSKTLFDIDSILGDIASSGEEGTTAAFKYANVLGGDALTIKFPELSAGSTDNIWNIKHIIGRENITNAVNMVDKNWSQFYNFKWNASFTNGSVNEADGKQIDSLAEILYQTQEEVAAIKGSNTSETGKAIEVILKQAMISLEKSTSYKLDYNDDNDINSADYEDAKSAGVGEAHLNAITSAVNRLERVTLALTTVGKVGYTQISHNYTTTSPLKKYWQATLDPVLADLLSMGDGFDYGLMYKTDCSGFASYVIGVDNGQNTGSGNWVPTTSVFASGPYTVTLPPIEQTVSEYNSKNKEKLDNLIKCIYSSGSSITYPHSVVTWGGPMSNLKPGDLVTSTDAGHVIVYIGPKISSSFPNSGGKYNLKDVSLNTSISTSTYYFVECTSFGGILGPGTVKLSEFTADKLNSNGYVHVTSVDYDLRNIKFE